MKVKTYLQNKKNMNTHKAKALVCEIHSKAMNVNFKI